MKSTVKRGPKSNPEKLLTIWRNNFTKPLPFHYILNEGEKIGYTKRTVINYLNQLVRNGVLEKIVDVNRNTFYKPLNLKKLYYELLIEELAKIDKEEFLAFLYRFVCQNEGGKCVERGKL